MAQPSLIKINIQGGIVINEGSVWKFWRESKPSRRFSRKLAKQREMKIFGWNELQRRQSHVFPHVIQLMDECVMCKNLGTPLKSSFKLEKKILKNVSVHDILEEYDYILKSSVCTWNWADSHTMLPCSQLI